LLQPEKLQLIINLVQALSFLLHAGTIKRSRFQLIILPEKKVVPIFFTFSVEMYDKKGTE